VGTLKAGLTACRVPSLTGYQPTRHTCASKFVLGGGSIGMSSKLMGHSKVTTTERSAHLRADLLFPREGYDRLAVDLNAPDADVLSLKVQPGTGSGALGCAGATRGKTGMVYKS